MMDVEVKQKRKRSQNFTREEKDLLSFLVIKYKNVLENKKTDTASIRNKEKAWKNVAHEFNGSVTVPREWTCLRTAYDNIKRNYKKKYHDVNNTSSSNNNGDHSNPGLIGDEVLSFLSKSIQPLTNPYDSDTPLYERETNQDLSDDGDASREDDNEELTSKGSVAVSNSSEAQQKWTNHDRMLPRSVSYEAKNTTTTSIDVSDTIVRCAEAKRLYYEKAWESLLNEEERKNEIHAAKLEMLKAKTKYYESLSSSSLCK